MLNVCAHNLKFLFIFSESALFSFFFFHKNTEFHRTRFPSTLYFSWATGGHKSLFIFLIAEVMKNTDHLFLSYFLHTECPLEHTWLLMAYFTNMRSAKAIPFLSCRRIQCEGSQEAEEYVGTRIFERLAGTSQWSNICTTVKPLGLCILPSSPISLSILSLYFAGVNSLFSFLTMNRVPAWFYMRKSPWGLCRCTEDGAIVCWNMTIPDQWNIQLRATGHCCSCVVISSSGILQCTGEKITLFKEAKDIGAYVLT